MSCNSVIFCSSFCCLSDSFTSQLEISFSKSSFLRLYSSIVIFPSDNWLWSSVRSVVRWVFWIARFSNKRKQCLTFVFPTSPARLANATHWRCRENNFRDLFKFCPKTGFVISLLHIRKVILVGSCVVNGWLLIFRGSANKASFKRDDGDFRYRLNLVFHVMGCGCINFASTKERKINTG